MQSKMLIFATSNFIIMKKYSIALFTLLLLAIGAEAQLGNLLVKRSDKGLYIDHKVVAKEGLYSIGRIYYVHPHHLAAFNGIDPNKGLNLGQTLQIPLTDTNFNQRTDDGLPVYYEIGAGDGLSSISRLHNRVPVEKLRTWNDLRTDNINKGTKLIVGYLSMTTLVNAPVAKVETKEPATETQKPVNNAAGIAEEVVKEEAPVKKEVEKAPVEVAVEQTAPATGDSNRPVATETKQEPRQVAGNSLSGNGFFKPFFEEQVKTTPAKNNATLTAGIFKTTSGWQDAKYYILIDKVATGSIVRVTNPNNNIVIYAKVLGEMNGIRQNQGLDSRISNAAASALGIDEEEKFVVQVNY